MDAASEADNRQYGCQLEHDLGDNVPHINVRFPLADNQVRKQGVERDECTSNTEQLHQRDAARPFPAYGNQD